MYGPLMASDISSRMRVGFSASLLARVEGGDPTRRDYRDCKERIEAKEPICRLSAAASPLSVSNGLQPRDCHCAIIYAFSRVKYFSRLPRERHLSLEFIRWCYTNQPHSFTHVFAPISLRNRCFSKASFLLSTFLGVKIRSHSNGVTFHFSWE